MGNLRDGNATIINYGILIVRSIVDDHRYTENTSFREHICNGLLFPIYMIICDFLKGKFYRFYTLHLMGHHWWLEVVVTFDPINAHFRVPKYLYILNVEPVCQETETTKCNNLRLVVRAFTSLPPKM